MEQALSSKGAGDHRWAGGGQDHPVNAILRIMGGQEATILLCASHRGGPPKGGMGETTGLRPKNIHRLLEFGPAAFGFKRKAGVPLELRLLWWMRPRW